MDLGIHGAMEAYSGLILIQALIGSPMAQEVIHLGQAPLEVALVSTIQVLITMAMEAEVIHIVVATTEVHMAVTLARETLMVTVMASAMVTTVVMTVGITLDMIEVTARGTAAANVLLNTKEDPTTATMVTTLATRAQTLTITLGGETNLLLNMKFEFAYTDFVH